MRLSNLGTRLKCLVAETADPAFTTLLESSYPKGVQDTARAARQLILVLIPGAIEVVDAEDRRDRVWLRDRLQGHGLHADPQQRRREAGPRRWSFLPDPRKLLEGSGKVHRYIPLGRPADLRRPGLRPLLHATLSAWRRKSMASEVKSGNGERGTGLRGDCHSERSENPDASSAMRFLGRFTSSE